MLRSVTVLRYGVSSPKLLGRSVARPASVLVVRTPPHFCNLHSASGFIRTLASVSGNSDSDTRRMTSTSRSVDTASRNLPQGLHPAPEEMSDINSDYSLDPTTIPVGSLSMQEFLDTEKMLNELITATTSTQESVEQAFLLYSRLVQGHEANPSLLKEYGMVHWLTGNAPRSLVLLNRILGHWYQWRTKNADSGKLTPAEVLSIVDNWTSGQPPLPIDEATYLMLISAATKGGCLREAPYFAEHVFERMLEESSDNPRVRPTSNSCEAVLNAWAYSGNPEAPEMAQQLLQNWTQLCESELLDELPTTAAHLLVMRTWVNSNQECAPYKVEEVLHAMNSSNYAGLKANVAAYRIAIHAWVNSEENIAGSRAYALLVSLVRKHLAGNEDAISDADFFSAVIRKLAKERRLDMAEEVFHLLEELHAATGDPRFQMDQRRILARIMVYTFRGDLRSVKQAESGLIGLQRKAQGAGDLRHVPKRGYYGDLISAYIALHRNGEGCAVDSAEALLLQMLELHFAGVPNMLPSPLLFHQILECWASRHPYRADAAERAESLLNIMRETSARVHDSLLKPSERCYFHVITAWSRAGDEESPYRAEKLFSEMLDAYQHGDISMKPRKRHYTALITAWARSGSPDAVVRAQSIFNEVISLYKAGDRSFKPDNKLCTSFMRALAKVGNGHEAETVLQFMRRDLELLPDTVAFNQVLEAWLASGDSEATERSSSLFDYMVELSTKTLPGASPDGHTYQLMIDIVSRSELDDAADRALRYLEMLKESVLSKDSHLKSHVFRSYVSTITALCGSGHPHSKSKAAALIEELQLLTTSGIFPLPAKKEYKNFLFVVAKSGIPDKADRAAAKLRLPDENLRVTRDFLPSTAADRKAKRVG